MSFRKVRKDLEVDTLTIGGDVINDANDLIGPQGPAGPQGPSGGGGGPTGAFATLVLEDIGSGVKEYNIQTTPPGVSITNATGNIVTNSTDKSGKISINRAPSGILPPGTYPTNATIMVTFANPYPVGTELVINITTEFAVTPFLTAVANTGFTISLTEIYQDGGTGASYNGYIGDVHYSVTAITNSI